MNQYCRYCVNCNTEQRGLFYCYHKLVILPEPSIKRPNNCQHFLYSEGGDIISGRQYKAAEQKKHGQMQMDFFSIMEDRNDK